MFPPTWTEEPGTIREHRMVQPAVTLITISWEEEEGEKSCHTLVRIYQLHYKKRYAITTKMLILPKCNATWQPSRRDGVREERGGEGHPDEPVPK